MKSLFMIPALLLLSHFGFAQAKNIKINNTTGCKVYLSLRLSEPTIDPCAPRYEGDEFAISPYSVLTFDYTNYPGSTASGAQYFLYAKIFEAPSGSGCIGLGDAIGVGETCYGFPQSAMLTAHESNCTVCGDVKAIWYPQPNPNDYAILEIIP